jgi:hypothetical protein
MKSLSATASACRSSELPAVLAVLLLACLMLTQPGCLGITSNLMHMVGADMIPPQFEGLEESRLVIVTSTESSHYKDDVSAQILSKSVGAILTQKVDDVKLVRQSEIDQWRDRFGWENNDMVALGKEVEADKVVAIELDNVKLRDGKSMYRGSADVVVTVYDCETGDELYRREMDEYTFPRTAGQHITETTESNFRKVYLGMLASEIGRSFHAYDLSDTFALDGAIASQ